MSIKKPLIAALVAALLFGVWLADRSLTRETRLRDVQQARLVPFDSQDATEVVLENASGRYVLEKREDQWWLTEPIETRAGTEIATIIDNLLGARRMQTFATADLAQYGLAEPSPVVTVRGVLDGETIERTIMIGDNAPRLERIYAMIGGEDEVFTTGEWIRRRLMADLNLLRDRTLIDADPLMVDAVTIDRPTGTIRLARSERFITPWEMTRHDAPASRQAVEQLLATTAAATALSIDDTPTTPMAELGLDNPLARVTFEIEGGEETLSIGAPAGEDIYYVQSTSRSGIMRVRGRIVTPFLRAAEEWKSRRFMWHEPEEWVEVRTEAGGREMVLVRDEDGEWIYRDTPGVPLHPAKLGLFFDNLVAMQGTKRETPPEEREMLRMRYGITDASYRVSVVTADGRVNGIVSGQVDLEDGTAWMLRTQDNTLLTVNFEEVSEITRTRSDLEDKRLNETFADATTEVRIISTRRTEPEPAQLLVRKRQDDVWILQDAQGRRYTANTEAVLRFVLQAQEMEWDEIAVVRGDPEITQRFEFRNADRELLGWLELQQYGTGEDARVVLDSPEGMYEPVQEQLAALNTLLQSGVLSPVGEAPPTDS